jgi:hypothetical protein
VSISIANKLSGNYINTKHPIIDENLKSIRRKLGNYQRGKTPILLEELNKIINAIEKNESKLEKLEINLLYYLDLLEVLEDRKLYH